MAFTKFVSQQGMSLTRFADITSTNAAKILGMYPRKGVIAPGSDADLVFIDPNMRKTLTLDDLHADSDYSIWEGFGVRGVPGEDDAQGQSDRGGREAGGQLVRW